MTKSEMPKAKSKQKLKVNKPIKRQRDNKLIECTSNAVTATTKTTFQPGRRRSTTCIACSWVTHPSDMALAPRYNIQDTIHTRTVVPPRTRLSWSYFAYSIHMICWQSGKLGVQREKLKAYFQSQYFNYNLKKKYDLYRWFIESELFIWNIKTY